MAGGEFGDRLQAFAFVDLVAECFGGVVAEVFGFGRGAEVGEA